MPEPGRGLSRDEWRTPAEWHAREHPSVEGRVQSGDCMCSLRSMRQPVWHPLCPVHAEGRAPSPTECAGCGHVAKHHTRRDSVWNGLMAPYRVVWRCAWEGCGCPEYVKAPASNSSSRPVTPSAQNAPSEVVQS